jgi:hypothetical protein
MAGLRTADRDRRVGGQGRQPRRRWRNITNMTENVVSGKCLEVLHYSTANFAPVGQYACHGGPNQKWRW